MATPSEILGQMISKVEEQSDNLDSSISQVQAQIDDLDEQIDGVQNGMCAVAETDLTDYMINTKIPELEITYGGMFTTPFMWAPGANYGAIDYTNGGLTDWEVLDDIGVLVYKYEPGGAGLNWDGDTTITKLMDDFAFGNDYLTRPMTSGATYGLIPAKANLSTAKGILTSNKNKIVASETEFADYAP